MTTKALSTPAILLTWFSCISMFNVGESMADDISFTEYSSCEVIVGVAYGLNNGTIRFNGTQEQRKQSMLIFQRGARRCLREHLQQQQDSQYSPNNPNRQYANSAAMQRYLMGNQTGNFPFKRTDQTIETEKNIDRIDQQMRMERGINESRQRMRDASACMFRNSDCK